MLRVCQNCPGTDKVEEYLKNVLKDLDDEDEVKFSQWVTTDRSN